MLKIQGLSAVAKAITFYWRSERPQPPVSHSSSLREVFATEEFSTIRSYSKISQIHPAVLCRLPSEPKAT